MLDEQNQTAIDNLNLIVNDILANKNHEGNLEDLNDAIIKIDDQVRDNPDEDATIAINNGSCYFVKSKLQDFKIIILESIINNYKAKA